MSKIRETISVPADHPSLPGHFPGEPIVPGAVLLDEIVSLAERRGGWVVEKIITMKFHKILLPGTRFTVQLSAPGNGVVDFVCTVGDELLAKGRIGISPDPSS